MSTPQAARRYILKPSGLVHSARACALCAIAIVVEAICFVKEASACAVEAAHSTCYCRVFLVQAGPFLAELRGVKRVSIIPTCLCAFNHAQFIRSKHVVEVVSDSAALAHSQILYVRE